jgi:FtsP/CotA-like multicopper oxidase with cupredoxin domain
MDLRRWIVVLSLIVVGIGHGPVAQESDERSSLPIPPVLEPTRSEGSLVIYDLVASPGQRRFFGEEPTQTLGYNGDYLGPTIRLRRGQSVTVRVDNDLPDATTVHWHGATIPAEADGGPHQRIEPGGTWEARFTVDQPAATLWYHPHLMGTTAEQVYRGLAGLLVVEDGRGPALPDEYGRNDIPLILQERRFDRSGALSYRPLPPDLMHGYFGNALLVNGAIHPYVEVRDELIRLRILNGSNSTVLNLRFRGDPEVHQIAGDGGLLPKPVRKTSFVLSPGERVEVLLDVRGLEGTRVYLDGETNGGAAYEALELRIGRQLRASQQVPPRLVTLPAVAESEAVRTREFLMSTMGPGGRLTINGKTMDLSRIDERVEANTAEIWEIRNGGMMMRGGMMNVPHNFHVHGVQFRILEINGEPPPEHLSGWKDTVLLWPRDRVRIFVPFEGDPGIYMYHCHLLEHEDAGMMGQFRVESP